MKLLFIFLPVTGNAAADNGGRIDGSDPSKIRSSSNCSATIAKELLILSRRDTHVIRVI